MPHLDSNPVHVRSVGPNSARIATVYRIDIIRTPEIECRLLISVVMPAAGLQAAVVGLR